MDPLTHCLLGGVAAKSVHANRRRFWIMIFLGSAPDLDVLFNFLGSWAFAFQHRGITHSLVGLVLQPIFYAWVFQRLDPGSMSRRAWQYALPLTLHVICDGLTSHGVPLLSPFSFQEYSANLVAALGFVPIVFMAGSLTWIHYHRRSGWVATRPVWAAWAVYLMLSVSGKAFAVKLIEAPGESITALPTATNPFRWRAVYVDADTHQYHFTSIDLLRGRPLHRQVLAMPNGDFPVQASLKAPMVQRFLKENRWPVVRTVTNGRGGWTVEWGTLLFSTQGLVRSKVAVDVKPDGALVAQRKTFGFWDPEHAS